MLQVTRVYKLNNKTTSTFNMLQQNAILTAAQRNKTYAVIRFTGIWNINARCLVWRHAKISQTDKIVYLCFCSYVRTAATTSCITMNNDHSCKVERLPNKLRFFPQPTASRISNKVHRKHNRLYAGYLRADWLTDDKSYRQRKLYSAN
jgi:hypothetical protein